MSLNQKELYKFGPFSLDPQERILWRDGRALAVTPKVFDTLLFLVRNQGRVLSKDELLQEIWPGTFVEEVNLAVNISTLRKLLGENPQDGRYIVTVSGRGYRFVAEVRETGRTAEEGADGKIDPSQDKLEEVPQSTLRPRPNGRKWAIAVAIVLLVLAGIGSYLWR